MVVKLRFTSVVLKANMTVFGAGWEYCLVTELSSQGEGEGGCVVQVLSGNISDVRLTSGPATTCLHDPEKVLHLLCTSIFLL